MPSSDPGPALDRVRAICLALPGSIEKLSHGIPAFAAAGRMFAYFRHNHHGAQHTDVCVRTGSRDEQAMLIEQAPALYSWPAYIGPAGWVAIDVTPSTTDWDHVADRIAESWRLATSRTSRRTRA
ncbi:MmcQ/YjbR family DNA-binding protein [Sphingomonas flavalba]|uniref:MmcQ/YjbR family DNA-binding protein n=1 Tax=Sphingomonas flavalba TaxID=2559804 RepID=UPI0039E16A74